MQTNVKSENPAHFRPISRSSEVDENCLLSKDSQDRTTPVKIKTHEPSTPPIYPVQPFAHSTPVFPKYSRHSINELLEKPITPIGQLRMPGFHNEAEPIQFSLEQNSFGGIEKKDDHLADLLSPPGKDDRNDSPTFSSSPISASSSPDSCEILATKKKSNRTNYTPTQIRSLEQVFLETPYPDSETMEQLAIDLNIPEQKIKVWFQNKRARSKKRVIDIKFQNFPPIHPFYLQHMPHLVTSQSNSYPMSAVAQGFFPYSTTSPATMMSPQMSMFPFPYMYTQSSQPQ